MSDQQPPESPTPPTPPKGKKGQGPATGGGVNWRVLVLMSIALGIFYLAWSSNSAGKTKNLTYKEFRNYLDSGKIVTQQDLPKKDGKTFPDVSHQLKKGGESAAVPTISGFFYENDPWIADKENSPQEAFRIPVNTQLNDDQLKAIQSRFDIPMRTVTELPSITDGKQLTLDNLARMLSRGEVITNDATNAFEMVSHEGSNDKYIVGKRFVFADAPAITDVKELKPFEIVLNTFEQSNPYDVQVLNELTPYVPDSGMMMLLIQMLPIILIVVIIFFLFRHQMKSAGKGAMSFGKSKAKLLAMDDNKVTFKDVAGIQEAKEELVEIVDYLRNPAKFQKLGGNLPKGLLMVGPPGTGKTLLARAIAGEADVPFFSISGSDFVEMFVGVGASRVRDMFEQGKKNSPCLIFIDEIDAVGRHRGHGMGGGHDEREQTLNALLVEMDGFDTRTGVIIIAATNRPDVLDPALLRPGRFDRQVSVGLPDINGREEILKVHAKRIKMAAGTDLNVIARGTPGFSGAELANLLNEAALLAARKNLTSVSLPEMEEARDKVRWGRERRSMALSEKEKENTAYHEAGHAILNVLLDHTDPLHKVTIIPRGPSLGSTMFLPTEDKYTYRQKELLDQLCVAMGGRVAEEITFGNVTNGAVGDIRMATSIARKMVCEWGMSESLGMVEYGEERGEVFVARDVGATRGYSEDTARAIDAEIKKLIDDAYSRAKDILIKRNDDLVNLSTALLEFETLDAIQVNEILEHGELKNPPTPPPSDDVIAGNQSDEGIPKKSVTTDPSSNEPPLAGEIAGEPA